MGCSGFLPANFLFGSSSIENSSISNNLIIPISASNSLTQPNSFDGSIKTSHSQNITVGSPITIPVPSNQVLQDIQYNITTINKTSNVINNSKMDKELMGIPTLWNLTSNLDKNNGTEINYNQGTFAPNNVLQLEFNGNKSNEDYSCFKSPGYNESFFTGFGWSNATNSTPAEHNITLKDTSLEPPIQSKAVFSKVSMVNNPGGLIVRTGELNKSFYYNGTSDVVAGHLSFYYKINPASDTGGNISVWIQHPNSSLILFENWFDSITNDDPEGLGIILSKEFDNPTTFQNIFTEKGEYTLVFKIEHIFYPSSTTRMNEIYLDEVKFWLNYTAREIEPGEIISLTQTIENSHSILSTGRLSFDIYLNPFISELNSTQWEFKYQVGTYEASLGVLNTLQTAAWINKSVSIPINAFSHNNFDIIFKFRYFGTSITRLNSTNQWSSYFDNIELVLSKSVSWAEEDFVLENSSQSMKNINFSFNPANLTSGTPEILKISNNPSFWFNNSVPVLNISTQEQDTEYIITGVLETTAISWRDFILSQTYEQYNLFGEYQDVLTANVISSDFGWSNLLTISPLFRSIGDLNYLNIIREGFSLHPTFGRQFAAYIYYLEETSSYSPSELQPLLGLFKANITDLENKTHIENKMSQFINQSLNQIPALLSKELDLLNTTLSNYSVFEIPENLNLTAFYYQSLTVQQSLSTLFDGNDAWVVLPNNSFHFPALNYWSEKLYNLEKNLKADQPKTEDFLPIQWLEVKEIKNESVDLLAGLPLEYCFTQDHTDNSTKTQHLTTYTMQMNLYHAMGLFNILFRSMEAISTLEKFLETYQTVIFSESWNNPKRTQSNIAYLNSIPSVNGKIWDLNQDKINMKFHNSITENSVNLVNGSKITLNISIGQVDKLFIDSIDSEQIYFEMQSYFPKLQASKTDLELLPSLSILSPVNTSISNTIIKSEVEIFLPDSIFNTFLLHGNSKLGNDYYCPILRSSLRIGNKIIATNWSRVNIFELTQSAFELNTSKIYSNIQQTFHSNVTSNTFTNQKQSFRWLPIIPKHMIVAIEWFRDNPKISIPLAMGELSGNAPVNFLSQTLNLLSEDKNADISTKLDIITMPQATQGTINHFIFNFAHLDAVNTDTLPKNFIRNLTISINNESDDPYAEILSYSTNIEVEFRFYYPLSFENPMNFEIGILLISLGLGGLVVIFIIKIRKRFGLSRKNKGKNVDNQEEILEKYYK
jgi:hypothetical protein